MKNKCNHCQYEWYQRQPEAPKMCPACKNRHWQASKAKKGKCTNCGEPMEQESTQQWEVYCTKPECFTAFKKNILKEKL